MSIVKIPFLLPYYSTVFLLFCSLHCLPPMFMFDPLSSLWSPGRPVEPMSVWWLSALHPPALLAEVDQWARLLDLRALLLPLPRHRYQHEEAVAGKQGWFHPKTAADFMGRFRFCLKLPQLGTLLNCLEVMAVRISTLTTFQYIVACGNKQTLLTHYCTLHSTFNQ